MKKQRLTLQQEANQFILQLIKSKSTIAKNQIKIIEKSIVNTDYYRTKNFTRVDVINNNVVDTYLTYLKDCAIKEMKQDFAEREAYQKEKKSLRKYPSFARYYYAKHQSYKYKKFAGTRCITEEIEKILRKSVFNNLQNYTNYRKIYEGINADEAGWRTEDNGKWGWNKVVWHYADYIAIMSKDKKQIFLDDSYHSTICKLSPNQRFLKIKNEIFKIELRKEKYDVKIHSLRRVYTQAIHHAAKNFIKLVYNNKNLELYYLDVKTGEKYHLNTKDYGQAKRATMIFKDNVVPAFRKRRAEKKAEDKRIQAEKYLAEHSKEIFVTRDNSLDAGNCVTYTDDYIAKLNKAIFPARLKSIRADVLLKLRDDDYTHRACVNAAIKAIN